MQCGGGSPLQKWCVEMSLVKSTKDYHGNTAVSLKEFLFFFPLSTSKPIGDYEDAIAEHQMEFDLSESIGDPLGSAVASRKIGESYCELGQYEKAIAHQRRHLEYAQREGSAVEEQRAYATLGRTYLCQSDAAAGRTAVKQALLRAQEAFVKSLEVCKRLADKVERKEYQQMKARLILNLGNVHQSFPCLYLLSFAAL